MPPAVQDGKLKAVSHRDTESHRESQRNLIEVEKTAEIAVRSLETFSVLSVPPL
jgi:hypothetical protein